MGIEKIEPKETALVLIELQNEFMSPGGVLYPAIEKVIKTHKVLENASAALKKTREKGVHIIHVPIHFSHNYREIRKDIYGILKGVVDGKAFKIGTWNTQFAQPVSPLPNEVIIEGKRGLCGFTTTNLEFVLRQLGVNTVVLAGNLANVCVESTMRTAYEKGFNVITLTDCVGATSEEVLEATVKINYPLYSYPMTHSESSTFSRERRSKQRQKPTSENSTLYITAKKLKV